MFIADYDVKEAKLCFNCGYRRRYRVDCEDSYCEHVRQNCDQVKGGCYLWFGDNRICGFWKGGDEDAA